MSTRVTTGERLAALEARMVAHEARTAAIEENVKDGFAGVTVSLQKLDRALTRYQGVWGGIMIVMTAIGSLIAIAKGWLLR